MTPPAYDFIPVDSTRRPAIPSAAFSSRARFQHADILKLSLYTLTEVSVGSGEKSYENDHMILRGLRDASGRLIIPGSSMKGVVATNYLMLSGSSVSTSNCFGTSATGRNKQSGPAISRVFFSDAVPDSEASCRRGIGRSWLPKDKHQNHVKIYTECSIPDEDYAFVEAMPKGTRLSATIVGENLREYELGGLLMSVGVVYNPNTHGLTSGVLKVGYGKPQCMGQLKVDVNRSKSRHLTLTLGGTKGNEVPIIEAQYCTEAIKTFINEGTKNGQDSFSHWKRIFIPKGN